MGFFQRLATLIKSNLNDLISRSEDPEKMLNQIVEDMTDTPTNQRRECVQALSRVTLNRHIRSGVTCDCRSR